MELQREEDRIVFRALRRCMKDIKLTDKKHNKLVGGYNELKKLCYFSRKNNPNEKFLTNIFFWPQDIGLTSSENYSFRLLYLSLLVNNLPFSKLYHKEGGENIVSFLDSVLCNLLDTGSKSSILQNKEFSDIIIKACLKCNKFSNKKIDKNVLKLVANGIDESIPF